METGQTNLSKQKLTNYTQVGLGLIQSVLSREPTTVWLIVLLECSTLYSSSIYAILHIYPRIYGLKYSRPLL